MNWGNKLVIVFIAFGAVMSYMVSRCMQTPVNVVSKEYYKDEIAYQEVIDGKNNANALSRNVMVTQDDHFITLTFPEEMQHKTIKGKIWFYCPAASDKDRKMILETNAGAQMIGRGQFEPGRYLVKIGWQEGSEAYYSEQSITIE